MTEEDLKPLQIIAAETSEREILDRMEIVAKYPVRSFQRGDSVSVKLASGETFDLHVDQPEAEGAGVVAGGVPLWEQPEDEVAAVLDVDLLGVVTLARVAVPALLRRPAPRSRIRLRCRWP